MKKALLLLFLLPSIAFSQLFKADKKDKPSSFLELQKEFDEYRHATDLQKTKGWKWYKRWESHYEQRLNPNGNIAEESVFLKEVEKINALKNTASRGSSSNWIPFGPSELPPSVDAVTSHGIGRINCVTFHPSDSSTIFVGVAQGGVWKTTNSGQSWTPLTDNLPIIRISDIAIDPNNTNTMYISVGDYAYLGVALKTDGRKRHTHYGIGVYKTTDGGLTWTPTGLNLSLNEFDESLIRRVYVNPTNSQELVAAGISGIYKSYDGGTTWTKKQSSIIWDLEANPKNAQTIYASTGFISTLNMGDAGILKSTNFGETWTTLVTSIPSKNAQRVELAVSYADTNYVYAITCGLDRGFEGFYKSINGGATWTKPYTSAGYNLLGWDASMGSGGGQGTYDLAIVADGTNRDKVYVGGINMWGTSDGGTTWDGMSYWLPYYGEYLHADQHQFAYNKLNNAYYVANDGGLYRTDNPIIGSWTAANSEPNYTWPTRWRFLGSGMQITSFYRLGLRENFGDVIAGAQDNSTFYREDNKWLNMIGGDGMECALHPTDRQTLYGSAQYGYLVRSYDGGQNFDFVNMGGSEEGEWTTPFKLEKGNPMNLYAGFENMHFSDDEGFSSVAISNFPKMGNGVGAVISAFDFSDDNTEYIYVAKRINHQQNEPMKFYVTTNGGNTWTNRTQGLPDSLYCTYIAVSNTNPQTAWACFSGFSAGVKVYKTIDAGATWTNISYNLPNIPVNTVVLHKGSPKNVGYIGTDAGVYYTYDGATTWELFSNMLPNVIVSELEIHADSNKIFAATFGRGIWMSDLADVNVGVQNNPLSNINVKLYPNKNDGSFTVNASNLAVNAINVSVVNILGQEVFTEQVKLQSKEFAKSYDLKLLPGVYYFRMLSGKYSKVEKFVVE
jgi:photosystem II stability/assembly factor-like uncharacterized protein